MALTAKQVQHAKPDPAKKITKLSDAGGLQLWVSPDGAKRWRFSYRFAGKQKTLALGVYPDMTLAEAREAHAEAKKTLTSGKDPCLSKKLDKLAKVTANANTFDAIAREFIDKKRAEGNSAATLERDERFYRYTGKAFGPRPISDLENETLELLEFLRVRARAQNHETVAKLRTFIGGVFRYAIQTGRAKHDPTVGMRGALPRVKAKPMAAITDPKRLGDLLRAVDGYKGGVTTAPAINLLILTCSRPGMVFGARWAEIDLKERKWSLPASRMKARREHAIPLSPQAVTILTDMKRVSGHTNFVFPHISNSSKHMSENTMNQALRNLGFSNEEVTGHGFRSTISSFLNETKQFSEDAIELCLAHLDKNTERRIYNRTQRWEERCEIMDYWGVLIDDLRAGKEITLYKRKATAVADLKAQTPMAMLEALKNVALSRRVE
ncbi:integrase arm-type DNA-binding domain-containing protein [Methylosinus sp. Sm6]|uniref:tyrosine-type recombinase/integrase n=1 Tax=Methylosinus sp. Sm6 TaxID=2866948 RepID=UPI001C9973ED|nr:integrase arm-type DNA-binding domain-containing protein [Methylosinus sp. Sm6]MBY6243724.1 integrase arm-type DNA-binding domain-containing protein [Methylosinus sp. Sm6]